MQLEEVHFNHDTTSASGDAITICRDKSSGAIVAPEWRRAPVTREPAAYARDAISGGVTIQARVSGGPPNGTRRIRAIDANAPTTPPPGCAGWISWFLQLIANVIFGTVADVMPKNVQFDAAGNSALESFTLNSPYLMPGGFVSKRNTVWKWQSKGKGPWVDFDVTQHTIYVIIDVPTAPWVQSGDATQLPWAIALDQACTWAVARATKDQVAEAITLGVNRVSNVTYTPVTTFGFDEYFLASYLSHLAGGPFVMNCTDCADAVTTLSNLLGCNLAEGQFFDMNTKPFLTLAGDPNNNADWVSWSWGYHEICWLNDYSSNTVWDGCMQLDMSNNPAVRVAKLPAKMPFQTMNADDYKPRLIASGPGSLNTFVRHRKVV
jgi:hypothetical protein